MSLQEKIASAVLSFKKPFTADELIEHLKEQEIAVDDTTLDIIEQLWELPYIRQIPFSDEYYVIF